MRLERPRCLTEADRSVSRAARRALHLLGWAAWHAAWELTVDVARRERLLLEGFPHNQIPSSLHTGRARASSTAPGSASPRPPQASRAA